MSDSLQPHRLYSPWNSPGQNTAVGSLSLLRGIFPTQGSNPGLPHYRQILYQLSHKGSPLALDKHIKLFTKWAHFLFPDKESACNAGDPGLIPASGRSPGEGIGYPLQYSWASLVAQLVKNSPAMWEIWVLCLGWEDPLEKGKATHSSILAWRIPWTL